MTKSLPEPDTFTLEEISARWVTLFGPEFTPDYIQRLGEGEHPALEVCWKFRAEYPDSASINERLGGLMGALNMPGTGIVNEYWITRAERDRFEAEHCPDSGHSGAPGWEQEPNAKSKNAYLRLIGVLAEWLSELNKLDFEKPFAGAAQISAKAKEYGANIGETESIGKKLKAAREELKAAKKSQSK